MTLYRIGELIQMSVKMRRIVTLAAVVSGLAAQNLVAACSSTVIAYQASGVFGAKVISGADKLKLAGEPFSMTLYVCQTRLPAQIGSNYAVYAAVEMTATVKSTLSTTPFNIKPTATTFILVHPATGPDSIQVRATVAILGGSVTIKAVVALPPGTLSSTNITTLPAVTIFTGKSGFIYSQGSVSTTLAVIGNASAAVYTPPAQRAAPLLYSNAAQVITLHPDGTQSVRAMHASPVEVGMSADTVMLQFYASGVSHADEIQVRIAGQEVPVRYAGASARFPGLDEVTVEVPRSLAGIGDADVILTVDGQPASPVLMHIQ